MNENEFLLFDRLEVIKQVVAEYGEENMYISFSGGKDSSVVSKMFDLALPNNKIERVYANTGIEYQVMWKFVEQLAQKDKRITILKPKQNIKQSLEENGYPFKSKQHSKYLDIYQRNGETKSVHKYINGLYKGGGALRPCPAILKYQFADDFKLRVSDKCCYLMKEKPLNDYQKEKDYKVVVLGLMADEGGRRESVKCKAFKGNKMSFSPLAKVDKKWEEWFIKEHNVELCPLYLPPYKFDRTGCKGCPFDLLLEEDLKTMQLYFPNERKQCEFIWKPVYEEYRRLNYRLKQNSQERLF